MQVLLTKDPRARVSADAALKEEWLTKQHTAHWPQVGRLRFWHEAEMATLT